MMTNATKSFWVTDVSPNGLTSLRLNFGSAGACAIDLAAHLGDEEFKAMFPTYSYFLNYRINADGGLTWPGGFTLSAADLKEIGDAQRKQATCL